MAIALEGSTTSSHGPWTTTPQTFSYSVANGSGNDRALFITIHWEDARTDTIPTSVTYGGNALTKIADLINDDTFKAGTQVWWMDDTDLPNIAGSNTVSVQFASSGHATNSQAEYVVTEFSGASQTQPSNIETTNWLSFAADAITDDITPSASDSMFLGAVTTGYVANVVSQTGTLAHEVDGSSSTGAVHYYQHTGSSTVTMDIELNGGGNRASYVIWELEQAATAEVADPINAGVAIPTNPSAAIASSVGAGAAIPGNASAEVSASIGSGVAFAAGPSLEVAESISVAVAIPDLTDSAVAESIDAGFSIPDFTASEFADAIGAGVAIPDNPSEAIADSIDAGVAMPTPTDGSETALHRINCGSESPYTDGNGDEWDADRDYGAGTNTYTPGAVPIGGTTEDTLYQTSRGVVASGGTFGVEYTLTVPDATDITVRVHLAELFFTSNGARIFDILIDGVEVEADVDIHAEVGHDFALVKEFSHTTTSTTLTVKVQNGSVEKATINALEVLTASAAEVADPINAGVAIPAGPSAEVAEAISVAVAIPSNPSESIAESLGVGIEMPELAETDPALHRINCGGSSYTDVQGYGWDADRDFGGPYATVTNSTSSSIAGTTDDTIYQTNRAIIAGGGPPYYFTYTLSVPNATDVTVRLHFAEIYGAITEGGRVFDVKIDGVLVEDDLDMVGEVGLFTALVKEHVVTTTSTSLEIRLENGAAQKAQIAGIEVLLFGDLEEAESIGAGVAIPTGPSAEVAEAISVSVEMPDPSDGTEPADSLGVGVAIPTGPSAEVASAISVSVDMPPPVDLIEGDDLIVSPTTLQTLTSDVDGAVTPSSFTFTVSNPTAAAIRYRAESSAEWITLSRNKGTLGAGQSIQITATPSSSGLTAGWYNALVCVFGIDTHDHRFADGVIRVNYQVGTPTAATATYYVDYDTGSDSNAGTSSGAPWKHLPWDANATGTPAAYIGSAGDEIIMAGGVHYRGRLNTSDGGSSGNPIVLDGNTRGTFGTGAAILDGSELVTGWTSNGDGSFTADISGSQWVDISPLGFQPFDGDDYMTPAQWPVKPAEKFRNDDLTTWQVPDSTDTGECQWSGFAALPENWWQGAYLLGWALQNRVGVGTITGFDSGTNTVFFTGFTWTDTQTPRFVVINSTAFLDNPGEFVIDETAQTITAIPYGNTPSNISGITQTRGIHFQNDHVLVRGLIAQRVGGNGSFDGTSISGLSGGRQGVTLDACQIRWNPSDNATIDFRAGNTGITIKGCAIYQNLEGRDISITSGSGGTGATDGIIHRNILFASGGTAIYTSACDGVEITQNRVFRALAVHANGISAYSGSKNVTITENVVRESNFSITLQLTSSGGGAVVAYNECDLLESFLGYGFTLAVYSFSSSDGVKIWNNTFTNPYGQAVSFGTHSIHGVPGPNNEFRNNIAQGVQVLTMSGLNASHNLIMDAWDSSYTLQGTDAFEADVDVVFEDFANDDLRLAIGSPAIDMGTDVGLTIVDQYGSAFDAGAYEWSIASEEEAESIDAGTSIPTGPSAEIAEAISVAIAMPTPSDGGAEEAESIGAGAAIPGNPSAAVAESLAAGAAVPVPTATEEAVAIGAGVAMPAGASAEVAESIAAGVALPNPSDNFTDEADAIAAGVEIPSMTAAEVVEAIAAGVAMSSGESAEVAQAISVGIELPEASGSGGTLTPAPNSNLATRWAAAIAASPHSEPIVWQETGEPDRVIRAIVHRSERLENSAGEALRFQMIITVAAHSTLGVLHPSGERGRTYWKARRHFGDQPTRFKFVRKLNDGASGVWELLGVSTNE